MLHEIWPYVLVYVCLSISFTLKYPSLNDNFYSPSNRDHQNFVDERQRWWKKYFRKINVNAECTEWMQGKRLVVGGPGHRQAGWQEYGTRRKDARLDSPSLKQSNVCNLSGPAISSFVNWWYWFSCKSALSDLILLGLEDFCYNLAIIAWIYGRLERKKKKMKQWWSTGNSRNSGAEVTRTAELLPLTYRRCVDHWAELWDSTWG